MGRCRLKPYAGGSLFPGARGAHSAPGPGQARGGGSDRDLMKESAFHLSSGRTGAGLRPGSSGRCPLSPAAWKEPAARFSLWDPGFAFHLSSRPVLSSEGAERRGAHPLGPPCDDEPPCRAGHCSPGGRGFCRRDNFRGTPFPGALRCARSQAAELRILCLLRGRDGRRSGSAWELWGEGRNPSASGLRGSV